MSLDWEPLATPKKGHEQEYDDLFKKIAAASAAKRERLFEWFSPLVIPPFETIGAPRVGYDEAADEWLIKRAQKSNRMDEIEALKKEMRGYYVLEIMPPSDGFPVYSTHLAQEHLERYAFNASLLLDMADLIGEDLVAAAQNPHLAPATGELGGKLEARAKAFVAANALPEHVATIREPVFPEGSNERRAHIVFAAAKWCLYWSGRGYGLVPIT